MSRIEQIVMDYFKHNDFNLKNLINFLEEDHTLRYQIWHEMEQDYRRRDLEYRIDQYNQMHNTDVTFTDEEINLMLEEYDDAIDNSDDWYYMSVGIAEKWCRDKVDGYE